MQSSEKRSLLNVISLNIDNNFGLNEEDMSVQHLNKVHSGLKYDQLYHSFKRVGLIKLSSLLVESAIKVLINVSNLNLQIDTLSITNHNSDVSEEFTKPEYFKKGVGNLIYEFSKIHSLTDEFFYNINLMNLNTLSLTLIYKVIENFDIVRILKNIKNWTNIDFKRFLLSKTWDLWFKNINILIQSNIHDPIFLKCQDFNWSVDINYFNIDFWFTKQKSKKNNSEVCTFLHVVKSEEYSFRNFIIWEDEEVKQFYDEFSEHLSSENYDIEFIVPINCLEHVNFSKDSTYDLINNTNNVNLIQEINKANKISCPIYLSDCLTQISKYKELLPAKCHYTLWEVNYNKIDLEEYFVNFTEEIVEELSWIYISEIELKLQLSRDEWDLIKRIVSSTNCKIYLQSITLRPYQLEKVIEILDLLSECQNIESIDFEYNYFPTISNPLEAIREAKYNFRKKNGVISKLSIKLCQ